MATDWRDLLWQDDNHQDHIHVTHAGGTVAPTWPRRDKADED